MIFGMPGAGKTTLIQRVLPRLIEAQTVAVLVSEFARLNLQGPGKDRGYIATIDMPGGSVCCELRHDFAAAIEQIHDELKPDRLLAELSELATPQRLIDILVRSDLAEFCSVQSVVTILDCSRFEAERRVMSGFFEAQIRVADVVALNKTDVVKDPQRIKRILEFVREINPGATIIPTVRSDLPLGLLLERSPALTGDARSAPLTEDEAVDAHAGFQAFVVSPRAGIEQEALRQVFHTIGQGELGEIIRARGFVETPEGVCYVDYVPQNLQLRPCHTYRRGLVFVGRDVDEHRLRAIFSSH